MPDEDFIQGIFCSLCTTAACLGRRMERDIFHMKKQSAVLGTCEPAAFILSLRDGNEFCKTHSSGYHCIPHIGEYVVFILLFLFAASVA